MNTWIMLQITGCNKMMVTYLTVRNKKTQTTHHWTTTGLKKKAKKTVCGKLLRYSLIFISNLKTKFKDYNVILCSSVYWIQSISEFLRNEIENSEGMVTRTQYCTMGCIQFRRFVVYFFVLIKFYINNSDKNGDWI